MDEAKLAEIEGAPFGGEPPARPTDAERLAALEKRVAELEAGVRRWAQGVGAEPLLRLDEPGSARVSSKLARVDLALGEMPDAMRAAALAADRGLIGRVRR